MKRITKRQHRMNTIKAYALATIWLAGIAFMGGYLVAHPERVRVIEPAQAAETNHLEPSPDKLLIIEVREGETNDQAEARTRREIKEAQQAAAEAAELAARTPKTIAERKARAAIACGKAGLAASPCVNDLVAMNWAETRFKPMPQVGDAGLSHGYFQIQLAMHGVTKKCANDFDCAADWTVEHLKGNGYPEMRTYAISKHNGSGPAAQEYAAKVKAYAKTL